MQCRFNAILKLYTVSIFRKYDMKIKPLNDLVEDKISPFLFHLWYNREPMCQLSQKGTSQLSQNRNEKWAIWMQTLLRVTFFKAALTLLWDLLNVIQVFQGNTSVQKLISHKFNHPSGMHPFGRDSFPEGDNDTQPKRYHTHSANHKNIQEGFSHD